MVIPIVNKPESGISPQMANQQIDTSVKQIQSDNSMTVIADTIKSASTVVAGTVQRYIKDKDAMIADNIYNNFKKFVDTSLYSQDDETIKDEGGSVSVQKRGYLFKKGADAVSQSESFNSNFQIESDVALKSALSNVKDPEVQRNLISSIGDLASRSKVEVAKHIDSEYTSYINNQVQALVETEINDTIGYDNPKQLSQSFSRIKGYINRLGNINSLPPEVTKNNIEKAIASKLKTVATKRTLADSNKRDGYSAAINMVYSQKGKISESVINNIAHDLEKEQIQNEFLYSKFGNLTSEEFSSLISSKKSLTQYEKTNFLSDYKDLQDALAKRNLDARSNLLVAPVEARISSSQYPDQATARIDYIVNNFGYALDPQIDNSVLTAANIKIKERFGDSGVEDMLWIRNVVNKVGYEDKKTKDTISSFISKIKTGNTEAASAYLDKNAIVETNFANFIKRTTERVVSEDGTISLTDDDWKDMFKLTAEIDSLEAIGYIDNKRVNEMKNQLAINYFQAAVRNSDVSFLGALSKEKGLSTYLYTKLPFTDNASFEENINAYLSIASFSDGGPLSFPNFIAKTAATTFSEMRNGTVVGVTRDGSRVQLSANGIPSGPAEELLPDVMLNTGSRFLRDKENGADISDFSNLGKLNPKQINKLRQIFEEELATKMKENFNLKNVDAVVVGNRITNFGDRDIKMADYASMSLNENIGALPTGANINIKSYVGTSIPEKAMTINDYARGISFIKSPTTRLYNIYSTSDSELGYTKKKNYTLINEKENK